MWITVDHNARTYSNRRICKICNQKHPTGLHGYVPKRRGGSNINATTPAANSIENDNLGVGSVPVVKIFTEMDMKCVTAGIPTKIISVCVVLVKFGHVGTKKEVSTLAMLDNCSQGKFMKESFKKKFGVTGRNTRIMTKTLNGKQNMESTLLTDLKFSINVHGEGVRWLNLPATYTREDLPAGVEEVATEEKTKEWEHLTVIAGELSVETNKEVGLLIGADWSKALESKKVLPSKDSGPFAFRTPLGWCVIGLLTKLGKESSIPCNQIVVQDAATRKMVPHQFRISSKVEDISAKQMLENMHNRVLC